MSAVLLQVGQITNSGPHRLSCLESRTSSTPFSLVRDGDGTYTYDALKRAGILRPGSLTQANRLAASLVLWALESDPLSGRAAILTCSASSVFAVSRAFELDGLASNWRLINPFHLPNSIPTALATSTARLSPAFELALAFAGTGLQVLRALQFAISQLERGKLDECWVVAAEQAADLQSEAAATIGMRGTFSDSAGLVRLARTQPEIRSKWAFRIATADTLDEDTTLDDAHIRQPNATQSVFNHVLAAIDSGRSRNLWFADHASCGLLQLRNGENE